eukprot:1160411-Pyramimonas_sp.AAC.1
MQASTARVEPREALARAARASDAHVHRLRERVKEVLHQVLAHPRHVASVDRAWPAQPDNSPGLRVGLGGDIADDPDGQPRERDREAADAVK